MKKVSELRLNLLRVEKGCRTSRGHNPGRAHECPDPARLCQYRHRLAQLRNVWADSCAPSPTGQGPGNLAALSASRALSVRPRALAWQRKRSILEHDGWNRRGEHGGPTRQLAEDCGVLEAAPVEFDHNYRALAEQAMTVQQEIAATLASMKDDLAKLSASRTSVETILKQVG